MKATQFLQLQESVKVSEISGRYLPPKTLERFLKTLPSTMQIATEGKSVCGEPVYSLTVGNGACKILLWSQMHGNESTTTKAVIDFLELLKTTPDGFSKQVLKQCTLKIIPMLNPDGAQRYTRINANQVDLNRDAKAQSQPESKLLQRIFTDFRPDYCFNLHDQRTIFGTGKQHKPATLSFLAPAYNKAREINETRFTAMNLIAAMHKQLQEILPNQTGRYDDAFNENCVGDHFQAKGVPTILFEAGHFAGDYPREKTRAFVFVALCAAIDALMNHAFLPTAVVEDAYLEIPENEKDHCDLLLTNIRLEGKLSAVGVQFEERLVAKSIKFIPIIAHIGKSPNLYGHREIDGKSKELRINEENRIEKGTEIKQMSLDNEIFSTNLTNS